METYDAIVIGSGCGALIAEEATAKGLRVALIDKGPLLGGTCLNWGCIPSKMLIYTADRIADVQEMKKYGVDAEIKNIDFAAIMERMRQSRRESQKQIRDAMAKEGNPDWYEGEAVFTDEYILEVNGQKLKGDKIFIASGSRPLVPPIPGLDKVDYLNNESVLELTERPESLIIIGGGYIAVEYGHFFAAMGTKVTLVEMADRLVLSEEPEIADLLKKSLQRRMTVLTSVQAESVKQDPGGVTVTIVDKKSRRKKELSAEKMMVATGRRSNADLLKVEKTGVEVDQRGFIKVNEKMETNRRNIYAVGDANGRQMFTHMANREAETVVRNVFHDSNIEVDYSAVPHAVYSRPQIASVGLRQEEAAAKYKIIIGTSGYLDTAKGEAMMENEGFAKAIVDEDTLDILGFHIIGPHAPELIQEVVNAMTSGGGLDDLNNGIHIHPALSELVPFTTTYLEETPG